jgi:spore maturation protein CgeB
VKVLVVHPGVQWSVGDVEAGLSYGLSRCGVEVVRQALDSTPLLAAVQAASPDVVIVVSGILVHPAEIAQIRAAGFPVYVLFTESPYDQEKELRLATLVDGCWTHERASVAAFRAVNPQTAYLPHAWHPEVHGVGAKDADVPAHDVVFVGSGFPERITFFNTIDWTGIDLGLYGIWDGLGLKESLEPCIKSGPIDNRQAAALYRKATIGLNLYRRTDKPAESLNPRAYELAACGCFALSHRRAEYADIDGLVVPQFGTSAEAAPLITSYLRSRSARPRFAAGNVHAVAGASWDQRATHVVSDLAGWQARATPAFFGNVAAGPRRPWAEAA